MEQRKDKDLPAEVCVCVQIISLGSHSIDADFEQAVLLMEIMPSLLAKRHFDPLNTLAQLEPGYRDSPEPDEDMAIMFVKVRPLLYFVLAPVYPLGIPP